MDGTPFGRYRLIELLGRGGMGEVWKAFDTAMNRVVALKLLPANLADDEQYQARFRREAQAAAGLDEPHIVPIHDFGEIDGRLYVTMRLIDGKTVDELLVNGPLAPQRAVSIVEQIAAALNAAHRVGLVHRDVKPSNILVTADDFAYLIDFGIARAAGATKLTSTGTTIGTFAYMAPERFTTDGVDAPAADIYALTCVLYQCLTASQPFPGDSMERQISSHLTVAPPRPTALQPGLSPQMDHVIATGMAKDPAQRYATTKDLAAAARAALAAPMPHQQPPAPNWHTPLPYPVTTPNQPAYSVPTHYNNPPNNPAAPPAQSPPWYRQPAVLILGALATVVAGVGVVAVFLIVGSQDKTSNGPSAGPSRASVTAMPSAPFSIPVAPSINSPTPTPTAATPAGSTQLHTVDGLSDLFGSMREKWGDAMGFQLVVYPDYAVVERVDPANSHVEQDFMYRGSWQSWGSDTTTSAFDYLADLSAIDVAAVITTMNGAPQAMGAPDNSASYLIISGAEGGGLELAIHSTSPGTGYLQVDADGTVKKVFPP